MASNIDVTQPRDGDTVTADTRSNFGHAASEIEALQAKDSSQDGVIAGKEPADPAIQNHINSPHAPADANKNVNADWNSGSGDSQILNRPATFPPAAHTHTEGEITNLDKYSQLEVDNKVGAVQTDLDAHKDHGNLHLSADERAAMDSTSAGGNPPTVDNPFITADDFTAGGGHVIQDEGVGFQQRPNLNFVGAGVTVTDNPAGSTDVTIPGGSAGTGDMTKAVYDTNDNGVVDNSEALNGKADTAFATAAQGALADTASQPGHGHTLSEVSDAGGMAAVDDAPADGKNYGRADNAWFEIVVGGGDLTDATFPTHAKFAGETAAVSAVDFTSSNKQRIAGAAGAVTLAAPGVGSYLLLIADGSSITSIADSGAGAVKWIGGAAPAWNGESLIACYYDGTDWILDGGIDIA